MKGSRFLEQMSPSDYAPDTDVAFGERASCDRSNKTGEASSFNDRLTSLPITHRDARSSLLTYEVYARVDQLSPSDWQRLFPGVSAACIRFSERTSTDGFIFRSIVVKQYGRIILCLPLFEMTYNLSSVIQGKARAFAIALARRWPSVLCPRTLGVGFVGGKEGQIGYAQDLDRATLEAAWNLALEALDALAQELKATFLTFVNFTNESGRWIPMQQLARFTSVKSLPYCAMSIVYDSLEGYLGLLSKSTRKDLRRKLRNAHDIEIRRTREPGPWLETMYAWYLRTIERSDVVFGVQGREYFAQVCHVVPGAEFVLYFHRGTLLAFNLVIAAPECLKDQYFCMDADRGSQYALYFISWLENIRYCISRRIPRYDTGQCAEGTKRRLRTDLVPSLVLFHHRNPALHALLTICLQCFASRPADDLPSAQLGLGWEAPRLHAPWKSPIFSVNPRGSVESIS